MSTPRSTTQPNPLKQAAIVIQRLEERLASLEQSEKVRSSPIAIVGIGCRFPGGADTPQAFWELLSAGREAIQPLEPRWALWGEPPRDPVPRWAGLLTEAVDEFDAEFFGISPREARSLDPQHRLLLEVAWESLEDAGIPPRSLMDSRTGVFVGACTADYIYTVQDQPREEQDAYGLTGTMLSVAAGRLSYTLGMQGPCLTVDTACSSSLVAVHLACRSLRAQECELALAGGVNLLLSPETMEFLARTNALSPDGRCKTFDALANGFVRGEGCGLLVLKRLADARRDGDRVLGLLRGSAINQDGRSTGLTAPNVRAQEALLREAIKDARVDPAAIEFVETHGTGTALGDPIEVEALRAVLGAARPDRSSCVLGAVKTNIGHLEGAAGVAGLIKAILALRHERIPQNLNFRTLNAHIELAGSALSLATAAVPWPRGEKPRLAGVSSFGMSGTNAHAVLQEAPRPEPAPARPERPAELFLLSAASEAALAAQAARLRAHLQAHAELPLGDVAYSLLTTRSPLEHRLALTATSGAELEAQLDSAAKGHPPAGAARGSVASGRGKLAFLFTGQGAQVPGMGRGLYATWRVFREALDRCAALFDRELEHPLLEVMWAPAGSDEARRLDQTQYTQPALFALEYALHALWRSFGITPELLAGHSIGELVAACVAGVFSLEGAVRLCLARGKLMQALPPGGAMVSIAAPEAEVAAAVAPHADTVSIAAVNAPEQAVISGEAAAVTAIAAAFSARGVRTRALPVSHAFHSPLLEPMLAAFRQVAESIDYQRPSRPLVSTLTGKPCTDEICTAQYWVRHVREAVRFADGVSALHAAGASAFVELGPGGTLLGLVPACLPGAELGLVASLRKGRDETASVLEALGSLWTRGKAVERTGLFPDGGQRVPLPTYAWQRQRHWVRTPSRRDRAAAEPPADWFYQVEWPELARTAAPAPPAAAAPWLILSDQSGVGEKVAAELLARGQRCTVLPAQTPELAATLEQPGGWQGAIYLGALDAGGDADSPDAVAADAQRALAPVLTLLQAASRLTTPARLWLITRGAVAVGDELAGQPAQAALWGLGRVAALEQPAAWGGLVDLDPAESGSGIAALVSELLCPDEEDELAFRGGRRHVARLRQAAPEPGSAPLALSAEGTYLVTGGLGRIGLLIARWLLARGARHLLLVGRRGLDTPGAAQAVEDLTAQGAQLRVAAVDVADAEAMAELLATVEPRVCGVLHCAGVGPRRPLAQTDAAQLGETLQAKVTGGWLLHRLLRDQPLEMFALFSSGTAVWGSAGQGAYAAANAFLDGLAHQRRARGLPALSINWGVWAEGGLGDDAAQAQLERLGVLAMPTQAALAALERLLRAGAVQRTVTRMDWARFAPMYAVHGRRKLLSELGVDETRRDPDLPPAAPADADGQPAAHTRAGLHALVRRAVAQALGYAEPEALPTDRGFAELGMDSLMAVELQRRLRRELGVPLPSTLAFDHPSVERLTAYLAAAVLSTTERAATRKSPAVKADEPIALIGAACRFPGEVGDLAAYWQLLLRGAVVTSEVPPSRWSPADWYDPDPAAAGRTYVTRAGFLRDVESFDAGFFRISPREALSLDPQQRLLLEVSWEALERAGQDPAALRDSATGVFIGAGPNEYAARLQGLTDAVAAPYAGTGNMLSVLSGRLSFFLGLHGPSLAVDTACSSSLVALHLGCQALRQGECGLALVGGVNVLLSPASFVTLSRMRALSPQGRCQTFAAAADGYARGEGCAVVLLKRQSDALRDGDRILALIRGSAVNHDGASSGLTVPNGPAQQAVLQQALEQAGVPPAEVDYVECHGTGTALGDPIEVGALSAVYGRGRSPQRPLVLGAAKANLGHLEPAAGLAGLLKAVLALEHEQIPAQPQLGELNPHIPWAELPVAVAQTARPWPRGDRPRRAGVSAFGLSGTNAHVVLEEAPAPRPAPAVPERPAELLILSARSEAALQVQAAQLRDHLAAHPELPLSDVAYSLARTRCAMEHRLALTVTSPAAAQAALAAAAQGQAPPGATRGTAAAAAGRLAFVFSGQGAQVAGMGRGLHATWPVFQEAFDRCLALFERELRCSLREIMWAEPGTPEAALLDQTQYTQPALFTLEYALYALWRSFGVAPDLLAGHSIGELVAACVAEVMSLPDAVRLVAARGRLMQALPPGGAMVAIAASEAAVAPALADCAGRVGLAAINGPEAVVIAGDAEEVVAVAEQFAARGVRTKRLPVSHAFHSPRMEPMLADFRRVADTVQYHSPRIALVENVSGRPGGPEVATAAYWVEHVRAAVRFADGVQALQEAGAQIFVEVGPQAPLLGLLPACLAGSEPTLLASLRAGRTEAEALLQAVGGFFVRGGAVDWAGVFPAGGRKVDLPSYPFERQRYWVDAAPVPVPGQTGHWALSGQRSELPGGAIHHVVTVGAPVQPYLGDHIIHGRLVVPAAMYAAVMLAAAAERWPGQALSLEQVEFLHALVLGPEEQVQLHLLMTPRQEDGGYALQVASRSGEGSQWILHAQGAVRAQPGSAPPELDLDAVRAAADTQVEVEELYRRLARVQIEWGPGWQWTTAARGGKRAGWTRIAAPPDPGRAEAPLHPVLLDNCFATHGLGLSAGAEGTPRLPFALERLWWQRPGAGPIQCGAWLRADGAAEEPTLTADLGLWDEQGEALAVVQGFALRLAPRSLFLRESAADAGAVADKLFRLHWVEAPEPERGELAAGRWLLVGRAESAVARGLREQLAERSAAVRCVQTPGLADALREDGNVAAIVCLWETEDSEADRSAIALALEALAGMKALREAAAPPRLWWVTAGAVATRAGQDVRPALSALWGLGRSVQKESPELGCRLIDLDPLDPLDPLDARDPAAGALLRELAATDDEPQVARRGARRLVARLVRAEARPSAPGAVPSDGTVLITGGLGALGQEVARWLAGQGVRHLILLSRRGQEAPGAAAATHALEQLGARVTVAAADVADRQALGAVLAAVPDAFPLRGIVHAAGVREDGTLAQQSPAQLTAVMQAKVAGAWNLHTLTAERELELFVLCSSVAGTLGSAGQGGYAAANAFLDGLAEHRRAQGKPAQSLAWGAWGQGGMAAALAEPHKARLGRQGMGMLSPQQGVGLLAAALKRPEAVLVAAALELDAVVESAGGEVPALWRELIAKPRPRSRPAVKGGWAQELASLPPEQRAAAVLKGVREEVARVLALQGARAVPAERPLQELGLDSLMAVELRNALGQRAGATLPATLAFDHPTPAAIASYLHDQVLSLAEPHAPAASLALGEANEPIAIIGIGCRFPGGVTDPESFWRLLEEGVDAIAEVPGDRWELADWFDPDPDSPGKMSSRWGGFLPNLDRFDPTFFGISPREAPAVDPQERLLLETSWEALERAGLTPEQLLGSDTGVYMGLCGSEYQVRALAEPSRIDAYSMLGTAHSAMVGRLSYWLGLKGPNFPVDTACSSSLVAIHLACQALRQGECSMALAGGANVIISPESMVYFSRLHAMSPTGRCHTFSADADGYVRGEGAGVVVLERLSAARRKGHPVLAVIRGSAVNQDGRSNGPTAPNGPSQTAVIQEALRRGGVEPASIGYLECHGTGTPLGDPIEVQAAAAALGQGREAERPLVLGSVKTHFGHTEGAAGVAGLIKAVLVLQKERIPKNLHFAAPNPHIPWESLPLRVASAELAWPPGAWPRRAGVSSFGFSGTNAHLIVEEAPPPDPRPRQPTRGVQTATLPLLLSGQSDAAVRAQAGRLAEHLQSHPELALADVCFTLRQRTWFSHRAAVVADSPAQAIAALRALAQKEPDERLVQAVAVPDGGTVLVFPGQGSQWPGMARTLYRTLPVFAAALDELAAALRPHTDWSLLEVLLAEDAEQQQAFARVDIVQPVLFAMAVSLARVWQWLGVSPAAVVGHSQGEVAAACVAGVLSVQEAAQVVAVRSRLLRQHGCRGAMAAVGLPLPELHKRLQRYGDRLSIAVVNSPSSTAVAGESAAVRALLDELKAEGVFCRDIAVDYAAHSAQVEPVLPELVQALGGLRPRRAQVPMISTVTGQAVSGEELTAEYWARNLRQPVRLDEALKELRRMGLRLYLEPSAHPQLLSAVDEVLAGEGRAVGSLRRQAGTVEQLLQAAAELAVRGQVVDWPTVLGSDGELLALPTYPFQRQRYWLDEPPRAGRGAGPVRADSGQGHPLLGPQLWLSTQADTWVWESSLSLQRQRWLGDHRVKGTALFPAAGYLELALAAGAQVLGTPELELTAVELTQALPLGDEAEVAVQVVAVQERPGVLRLQVASQQPGAQGKAWTVHARAQVRRGAAATEPAPLALSALKERLGHPVGAAAVYARLTAMGLEYGPAFQGVAELWQGEGEALGRIAAPETAQVPHAERFHVDPALLDACFQAAAGAGAESESAPWLPVAVGQLRLHRRVAGALYCHVRITDPAAEQRSAELTISDENGAPVAEVSGFTLKRLPMALPRREEDDWFLSPTWEASAAPAPRIHAGRWLILGDGGGLGGALRRELTAAGHAAVQATAEAAGTESLFFEDRGAAGVRALLGRAFAGEAPTGIVHLRSLDGGSEADPVEAALRLGCDSVLHLLQAIAALGWRDAPRLWLLTRGAQAVHGGPVAVHQAPLLGLGRTLSMEHSELRCARLDLAPAAPPDEVERLVGELVGDDAEDEVALRGDGRWVARLQRAAPRQGPAEQLEPPAGRPFRLELAEVGVLDRLALRATARRPPGPGEVEVEVAAAGLNFKDVLLALGVIPEETPGREGQALALGAECAGRITAVGEGVKDLAPGDSVIAIAQGAIASHVTARAALVLRRPATLSEAQAAALPIASLTAWYALDKVARLRRGERVLIHAATGGVGQAAIQWAQHVGAEIFATAGTPDKRARLTELGVRHVSDSRSTRFVTDILDWTGGEGVDVVLNSLTGELLEKSFGLLRPYGRFVEIGKRDYYANTPLGLKPFLRNLSFALVDLHGMITERPEWVGSLLEELFQFYKAGVLRPPAVECHPVSRAPELLRKMAKAQHTGKLVLTLDDPEVRIQVPTARALSIRAGGTYLVTGGLGGLGLSVAGFLARRGAGRLVLLGRSGETTEAQRQALAGLRAQGAAVTVAVADVSDRAALGRVLAAIPPEQPLRGVIHAAGLLDDGLLLQQTPARLRAVLAPKARGAWNLHELTAGGPLDFFVLYSSAAALLGSPGQGNYAAANAFLDALAHLRRAQALPALSINWGSFAEVGLAAAGEHRGQRLSGRGITSLTPDQGLDALWQLLEAGAVQSGVIPLDVRQWVEFYPVAAGSRRLTHLLAQSRAGESRGAARALRERIAAAGPEQRPILVEEFLREQASRVLRIAPEELTADAPLSSLGMDSLMGLELRNRIEAGLGTTLPATLLWTYPTLRALTRQLCAEPQSAPADRGAEAAPEPAARDLIVEEVAEMQTDELMSFVDNLLVRAGQGEG